MSRTRLPRLALVLAAAAVGLTFAACGTDSETCLTSSLETGPEMRPGWNCLSCHREKGQASAKVWTAAGTIYDAADAHVCAGSPEVDVVFFTPDGTTEIERVTTNAVGNFYTDRPLPEGFRVGVSRDGKLAMMPVAPPAGSCNACHSERPVGDALGRIRAP